MNRAISEVLETSHNKEISSLWPSVLCLLREDEVYGFHMKSQSIRGILRATPSTHTLVNGDRDCVESESRLPNTSRDGGPTPRINSDKVASKSFTMGAPSSPQFHAAALLFGPHTPREYVQGSQAEWLHMQVGGSFERTT
ncbi:uncharacterized protein LOC112173800 [Rosa chinensis]|uniref:uncharacterized protein LOC112173800 n=1 Tax=Rosa chinensis TaxID=74649 RepID=UPI001AD92ACD|nr:uncharacterized protein LOC112173800 [Rosa chinensis]